MTVPKEIEEKFERDKRAFYEDATKFKFGFSKAKEEFLLYQFKDYPKEPDQETKAEFVNQFVDWLPKLILFPDEDIFGKLREYKFSKLILRWFTNLDNITKELERLSIIKGFYPPLDGYLQAIHAHLTMSAQIDMMEAFELNVMHNNLDTNLFHKGLQNVFRKREYTRKPSRKAKVNFSEMHLNIQINKLEDMLYDKKLVKTMMLKSSRGDTSPFFRIFSESISTERSQRQIFLEMFPLFQLILKTDDLLIEEEFNEKQDHTYGASYTDYKIARIKKIILKK